MSGGVDSAVAAALLQKQSYDCIAVYMRFWSEAASAAGCSPANKCCTKESLRDAEQIAKQLGIPFYVFNVEQEFKKRVVDYFLKTHGRVLTPNPCVMCNQWIKFGILLKRAKELKADFLATGHYARTKNGRLFMAKDKEKDQTYFLHRLTAGKLRRVLFPVGGYTKKQIYKLAKKFGLKKVYSKKQSQGACFFPEAAPAAFLKRNLPAEALLPGSIVDKNGRKIGAHKGLPLYTIGQRRGFGIGGVKGEPEGQGWYVIGFNKRKNELIAGREKDIFARSFVCGNLSFISDKKPKELVKIAVRARHRAVLVPSALEIVNGKAFVKCVRPLRAPCPGQSAVFYKGNEALGGGIIEKVQFEGV